MANKKSSKGMVDMGRVAASLAQASLLVAVRVRPLLRMEVARGCRKDILRVMDGRVVLVLDPDDSKDYLNQVQNRTKEKRYTFDIAFDTSCTNEDIYMGTIRDMIQNVGFGINTTVFAYGATGSGKTYTMVGSAKDPGLMVLALKKVFQDRDALFADEDVEITCSYLEVYNEIIYDLLVRNSVGLELREDPELGVQVAGLKLITVQTADEILTLLEEGNRRRKTESTDANASSSRSHAVLEIVVKRTPRNHYRSEQLRGKLSLVDLAGSERAAETNNAGQKLRDGANINRSLLALANCINALGKAGGKNGASYVPYRNSKLTRLLKDGLSGNSRTAMIATVSASADQYHHSINTLKYADRAKEIKTHVVQNVATVESHVADYQRIIDNLQHEVQALRAALSDQHAAMSPNANAPAGSDEAVWRLIDGLISEMNDNIEERINLQKELFELEDMNVQNKYEQQRMEELAQDASRSSAEMAEAHRQSGELEETIKENEEQAERIRREIAANEAARLEIQGKIDSASTDKQGGAFRSLLSTFRLQAVRLQELKFQMAVRDQIITEQRDVISNLWRIIERSGVSKERIMEIAKEEGILMANLAPNGRPISVAHGVLSRIKGPEMNRQPTNTSLDMQLSLVGNRANARYSFWAGYPGDMLSGSDSGQSRQSSWQEKDLPPVPYRPEPAQPPHPPHPHAHGGANGTFPVMSSGERVQRQHFYSARSSSEAAARNSRLQYPPSSHVIKSGRRAGLPVEPLKRISNMDGGPNDMGYSSAGENAIRSVSPHSTSMPPASRQRGPAPPVSSSWQLDQARLSAALPPPAPVFQLPLNERLAKLKGRIKRTTEDGSTSSVPHHDDPPSHPVSRGGVLSSDHHVSPLPPSHAPNPLRFSKVGLGHDGPHDRQESARQSGLRHPSVALAAAAAAAAATAAISGDRAQGLQIPLHT